MTPVFKRRLEGIYFSLKSLGKTISQCILYTMYVIVYSVTIGENIVVQLLSHVWLFVTPWTAACQASLSAHHPPDFAQVHVHWIGDAIQPSYPLPLSSPLPSIFPSIRVFSNDLAVHIRWPEYWSFNFSISPSNECTGLFPLGLTGLISLQSKGFSKNLLHPGSDEGLAAFFNICRRVLSPLETLWLQWVT